MNRLLEQMNLRAAQQGIPLNATLELTPNCNLNCRMCYIHRQGHTVPRQALKPLPFWLDLAEQAKALGTLVIVLTGGETFLYPQAEELMEKLMDMGFLLSVNTNGTLLDEKRLDWLRCLRPAKVNVTLYGASNETYEKLCGCADGFTRASAAIDRLLADGQNVYLNGTCVRENVGDLPAMAEFARSRGLILHNSNYIFPAGRYGLHTAPDRLSPEEVAEADLLLERLQMGEDAQKALCREQAALVNAMLSGQIPARGGFHAGDGCSRNNCGGGKTSFAVTWDGRMLPCVTNSGIAIPLENVSLQNAWERLKQETAEMKLPGACVSCAYQGVCNACPATIYNETGCYDRPASYPCDLVRTKFLRRLRLLGE